MRRTPMSRGSGFKRPTIVRAPSVMPRPVECRSVMARVSSHTASAPIEKENALQHQGYMRLVRLLPCAHCGIVGFSQFCHSDEGKGTGIKTDCRRGWPGCRPHGETMGCHHLIGTSGHYSRDARRELEEKYAAATRALILAAGTWPARLPLWNKK